MTTYGISGLNSAIVSAQSGISWLKSFGSPTQVYDNTKTTVNGYIDTTKKTITDTQATIEKKVEQVNTAVDSLKKASDAIDEAQSAIAKIKS
jgi:prefoldin subunit 5